VQTGAFGRADISMRLKELKLVIKSDEDAVGVSCGKSNVLGIAAWLLAGRFGVQFPAEAKDFSYAARFEPFWGPHSLLFSGYRSFFYRG